jgi:hypothetical protein
VPLQGHWDRVNTPLRETTPRERVLVRVFWALLATAAVATVIVAIATSGNGTTGTPLGAGCIRIEVPSTMGGSSSDLCESKAASFCQSPAANSPPLNQTALPRCHDAGY